MIGYIASTAIAAMAAINAAFYAAHERPINLGSAVFCILMFAANLTIWKGR